MAENLKGTIIAAGVVPSTNADTYATHYEEYGQGGYRSVSTLNDRDSISDARKKIGMLVYVIDGHKMYRLDAIKGQGADNDIWTEVEAFNQKTVIASPQWWDDNKDNPETDKTTVYYVPEYTDEVDYYVTTSDTGTELFETPYGIYTTDSEEGTAFNPKRYKTNDETSEAVYKIDYYKTYQYIDGNWVEGTTKGDTSYILSDDLNVVYSKNYSGYCKALVAAGLEVRDSGTTTDDMTNMKQAIDVLYAYLFPADYIDWTFSASPNPPSADIWTYVNTDTVVPNDTENVIFKASNKQAQKSYKINKLEVNGGVFDTTNTATTEYVSSVTIPLYNAVAATPNIIVEGTASSEDLHVRRNVSNVQPNDVHDYYSTGNFSVSGVLKTQQEGKTESAQTLEPMSTFTLHALYQKPNDWNVSGGSTASKPYLGHIYSAKTTAVVSPNTLSATVKKGTHTVNRNDQDRNLNFFSGGTITLDGTVQQLLTSPTVSKNETFYPQIVDTGDNLHGTKVKVKDTPYSSTSLNYSYTVNTTKTDSVGNKPNPQTGNVKVAYSGYTYSAVTDWSKSNVDVKLVLADGSAGAHDNNDPMIVSGYVGQVISATCECVVSPNTKYDFSENDIDYQPTDAYKQDWTSVFTSDIGIDFNMNGNPLTPITSYIETNNSYDDRNKSASAKTDMLSLTQNGNFSVTVTSSGQVTDVMSGYPQSYIVYPTVTFVKKDWMFFVSENGDLNSVVPGTKVSGITDLPSDTIKGYEAYELPQGITDEYIYVISKTKLDMGANGLDLAYNSSIDWNQHVSDVFQECNVIQEEIQAITLPANSFDKQENEVSDYYLYRTVRQQKTDNVQIGYLKISGEKK